MKIFFTILSFLLFAPLTASASPVNVDVSFDVYHRLSLTVLKQMLFPAIYDDKIGTVTSEDSTEVLEEPNSNGTNACISILGPAGAQYSLVFADTTTAVSNVEPKSVIVVHLSVAVSKYGEAKKTGRVIDINGHDGVCIKGSVNFSGDKLIPSDYFNTNDPVLVTAVYDGI